ncbi:hypothetical protein D030_0750A, partial [Vibrio parahaemolyticus AQ3810]
MRKPLCL